jgi:hypothetical protein
MFAAFLTAPNSLPDINKQPTSLPELCSLLGQHVVEHNEVQVCARRKVLCCQELACDGLNMLRVACEGPQPAHTAPGCWLGQRHCWNEGHAGPAADGAGALLLAEHCTALQLGVACRRWWGNALFHQRPAWKAAAANLMSAPASNGLDAQRSSRARTGKPHVPLNNEKQLLLSALPSCSCISQLRFH